MGAVLLAWWRLAFRKVQTVRSKGRAAMTGEKPLVIEFSGPRLRHQHLSLVFMLQFFAVSVFVSCLQRLFGWSIGGRDSENRRLQTWSRAWSQFGSACSLGHGQVRSRA